jgi:hypothetical protein
MKGSRAVEGAVVITGKDIDTFRLCVLRSALKLEVLGLKRRGRAASVIIREEFGFKERNKEKLLEAFSKYVEEEKNK